MIRFCIHLASMLKRPFETLALTDVSVDSSLTTPTQSITFIHSVHDASWVRPRIIRRCDGKLRRSYMLSSSMYAPKSAIHVPGLGRNSRWYWGIRVWHQKLIGLCRFRVTSRLIGSRLARRSQVDLFDRLPIRLKRFHLTPNSDTSIICDGIICHLHTSIWYYLSWPK
jgi:hypothetical protein